MKRATVFLFLAVLTAPADAAERLVLRPDGFGPVSFGMTVAQAAAALGVTFAETREAGSPSKTCRHVRRADGAQPNLVYMVEDGKITRVEVFRSRDPSAPTIAAEGISVGSSESAVRAKYRERLKASPNTYSDTGIDIEVLTPDGRHGLVFMTEKGTVTSVRAGLVPSVRYIEGCL